MIIGAQSTVMYFGSNLLLEECIQNVTVMILCCLYQFYKDKNSYNKVKMQLLHDLKILNLRIKKQLTCLN